MNIFLEPTEIAHLTGRVTRPAQTKMLKAMGISHKVRPDGAVIVSRSHIEKVLDGHVLNQPKKRIEPNWNGI